MAKEKKEEKRQIDFNAILRTVWDKPYTGLRLGKVAVDALLVLPDGNNCLVLRRVTKGPSTCQQLPPGSTRERRRRPDLIAVLVVLLPVAIAGFHDGWTATGNTRRRREGADWEGVEKR